MLALMLSMALVQDDPIVDSKTGDRIQIEDRVELKLSSGRSIRGIVMPAPRARKDYDPSLAKEIWLDLMFERTVITGKVAVERQTVRSARILRPLSPAELKRILEYKKIGIEKLNEDELRRLEARRQAHEDWVRERERAARMQEQLRRKEEEQRRREEEERPRREALDFYARFPESDGWSEEKHKELDRSLIRTPEGVYDIRKPIKGTNSFAPADPKEAEFVLNYDLWLRGREAASAPE
jgi:hypothetical protein